MKNTDKTTIAIILPAYNEAPVIGGVLDHLPTNIEIDGHNYSVEVIVVNDGSQDETADVVSKRKSVRLINHLLNSGAGAATRTGLAYAKELDCAFAITMDADGQHAVNDVIKLTNSIVHNEADYIIGSRLLDTEGMPRHRIIGNKGLSFITFLIFGVFVTDSQSGLRAYNRLAMEKIWFHSNHYAFCSEMIWQAKRQSLRIKEIRIQAIYSDYSLGKGQSNWNAISIISQLIKRRLMEVADE